MSFQKMVRRSHPQGGNWSKSKTFVGRVDNLTSPLNEFLAHVVDRLQILLHITGLHHDLINGTAEVVPLLVLPGSTTNMA